MVAFGKKVIKKNLVIIVSAVAGIFLSCGSFGFGTSDPGDSVSEKPVTVRTETVDFKPPSMQEQAASGYWISRPQNNTVIIIGVSNRMTRENDEITAAKEDAARKAAMFHGIQGSVEHTQGAGTGGYFDLVTDYKYQLQYDTDLSKYIDKLVFDPQSDVYRIDRGVMVRFQYTANVNSIDYVTTKGTNGRPEWTNSRNLPKFEGFSTAVGFAQNQRWLKDTVSKATENAIATMIQDASTHISGSVTATSGQGASTATHAVSEGKLTSFQVIEMWIDPETEYVYILAIAKAGS